MVLWQHIVLCKSTLLGMRLAMVCVVCYVVVKVVYQTMLVNAGICRHVLVKVPFVWLSLCLVSLCVLTFNYSMNM